MASGITFEMSVDPSEFLNVDRYRSHSPHEYDDPSIAPWMDEPPTPPPKPTPSSFGRALSKPSFSSFSLSSKSSSSNLLRGGRASDSSTSVATRSRASESLYAEPGPSNWSQHSNASTATELAMPPHREIRKSRSTKNLLQAMMPRVRTKSKPPPPMPSLMGSELRLPSPELPPSPTTTTMSTASVERGSTSSTGGVTSIFRGRKKSHTLSNEHRPQMLPPPVPPVPIIGIDLSQMEGIVDFNAVTHRLNPQASFSSIGDSTTSFADYNHPSRDAPPPPSKTEPRPAPMPMPTQSQAPSTRSASSAVRSSRYSSSSDRTTGSDRIGVGGMFSDPWVSTRGAIPNGHGPGRGGPAPRPGPAPRGGSGPGPGPPPDGTSNGWDDHRVSPRSQHAELPRVGSPYAGSENSHGGHSSVGMAGPLNATSSWTVPESWHTVPENGEEGDEEAAGGSDDEATAAAAAKKDRRKTLDPVKLAAQNQKYHVRVYRVNNSYHVVGLQLTSTVAQLLPELDRRLKIDTSREPHRLYLKERGRERMLGPNERPADILRRRLEQAGYEQRDGLHTLGNDDWRHLVIFVYKSQQLGYASQDEITSFDSAFEYVNLAGRGMRTLPVPLYAQAENIVVLNLSQNPMIEIPLDFIQACTQLRELKMSNMAIKKVPTSLRHCTTLNRLDLTCNRIGDLDECGLERIPGLQTLSLENNRLERLPFTFPHLRALRMLNISNNKFARVPAVVCEMIGLQDLDISFNTIAELPEEIGQLVHLEQLIMVGNQVATFPKESAGLVHLKVLDCRRNAIADLSPVCALPMLETLRADHNAIAELSLAVGPSLHTLEVSWNDITRLALVPVPQPHPYQLRTVDLSHAKLSMLDPDAFAPFTEQLEVLKLDHNAIRSLPDSVGALSRLTHFSCSNNQIDKLPETIGSLQRLEHLDINNNSIRLLPATLWNCASMVSFNATSNLITEWHDPFSIMFSTPVQPHPPSAAGSATALLAPGDADILRARKASTAGSPAGQPAQRQLPALAYSLERLHLGENQFKDDIAKQVAGYLRELVVLNLSFNEIGELPFSFFKYQSHLEELYLSGNKLTNFPTENLERLGKLSTLFLNGNKLQTLPAELGKVQTLTTLDVGSNQLKYNINNSEYDWNWNMNPNLRYLNLSGNQRLAIKVEPRSSRDGNRSATSDFESMHQLRVIGLMDITTVGMINFPLETEDRRVRTQGSQLHNITYGIADTVGKAENLSMFDSVNENFRGRKNEFLCTMFGRAQAFGSNNKLAKHLHDEFGRRFAKQLQEDEDKGEFEITHTLRRTFLRLNKYTFDYLRNAYGDRKMSAASMSSAYTMRKDEMPPGGASGIAVYIVDKVMYVANVGNALAVVSRGGHCHPVSRKHDPWDRHETARIRAAEGWISPTGLTNNEIDLSRSFGFYKFAPMVNCKPDVHEHVLEMHDDFLIVANRGLWDYVSFQTAVDIARAGKNTDPMIAAQKLRDFAISYGADGSIMIMVFYLGKLVNPPEKGRKDSMRASVADIEAMVRKPRAPAKTIADSEIIRLGPEIEAPTGTVTLVFTDIRNSTTLWETNKGMGAAMRVHNKLLRRWLRLCGGYEVKTEGDAFMCSFSRIMDAVWWCLRVQVELLAADWPKEILDCDEGREIYDNNNKLIARGLSVRMGIHVGNPNCEPDPVTERMDYFGPMVNRSARITGSASGGQIAISADILAEINTCVLKKGQHTETSFDERPEAIQAVADLKPVLIGFGLVQLKGIESAEHISFVYPQDLVKREGLKDVPDAAESARPRLQFRPEQVRDLGLVVVRLEALASARVFKPVAARKGSTAKESAKGRSQSKQVAEGESGADCEESLPAIYLAGDPEALVPKVSDKASEEELLFVLESLSIRLENAFAALRLRAYEALPGANTLLETLQGRGGITGDALERILAILNE